MSRLRFYGDRSIAKMKRSSEFAQNTARPKVQFRNLDPGTSRAASARGYTNVKRHALLFLTIRGILGGVPASLLNSPVAMPEPGTLLLLGAFFATPKGRNNNRPGCRLFFPPRVRREG